MPDPGGGFASALARFASPGKPAVRPEPRQGKDEDRQDFAGDGSGLPEKDKDEPATIVPWMPVLIDIPTPATVQSDAALRTGGEGVEAPELPIAATAITAEVAGAPAASDPIIEMQAPATAPEAAAPATKPAIAAPITAVLAEVAQPEMPLDTKPAPRPKPVLQPHVDTAAPAPKPHLAPLPRVELMQRAPEAAMAAAELSDAAPTRREAKMVSVTTLGTATIAEAPRAVAQPVAQSQQPPLDTRRDDWIGGMIDRIETLRDSAESGSTRIRLSPDALGAVDVSIEQHGDEIRVHIATSSDASRALLADATPRLSELAEARGLRLAETLIGGGGTQPDSQRREATPARAPNSARNIAVAADASASLTDERIA